MLSTAKIMYEPERHPTAIGGVKNERMKPPVMVPRTMKAAVRISQMSLRCHMSAESERLPRDEWYLPNIELERRPRRIPKHQPEPGLFFIGEPRSTLLSNPASLDAR